MDFLIVIAVIVCVIVKALTAIAIIAGVIAVVVLIFICVRFLIDNIYFNSKKFLILKDKLKDNTIQYNELNEYIEQLRMSYFEYASTDYGKSRYLDNSVYNFKRPNFNQIQNNSPQKYYCSLSVCRNAQSQPFKYLCKYFHIKADEDTLNRFETIYNNFIAAEEGKQILIAERSDICENFQDYIPFIIRRFRKNTLFDKLGYTPINEIDTHFPKYSFTYVSAGGNSRLDCDITLDLQNLERFVSYLYDQVAYSRTIKYQRSLMTKQLREYIKERDNYTCLQCGISICEEPHLLLEIDHIIPISKGGKTTIDNLQTLCWKCNRTKSSKLYLE